MLQSLMLQSLMLQSLMLQHHDTDTCEISLTVTNTAGYEPITQAVRTLLNTGTHCSLLDCY